MKIIRLAYQNRHFVCHLTWYSEIKTLKWDRLRNKARKACELAVAFPFSQEECYKETGALPFKLSEAQISCEVCILHTCVRPPLATKHPTLFQGPSPAPIKQSVQSKNLGDFSSLHNRPYWQGQMQLSLDPQLLPETVEVPWGRPQAIHLPWICSSCCWAGSQGTSAAAVHCFAGLWQGLQYK